MLERQKEIKEKRRAERGEGEREKEGVKKRRKEELVRTISVASIQTLIGLRKKKKILLVYVTEKPKVVGFRHSWIQGLEQRTLPLSTKLSSGELHSQVVISHGDEMASAIPGLYFISPETPEKNEKAVGQIALATIVGYLSLDRLRPYVI